MTRLPDAGAVLAAALGAASDRLATGGGNEEAAEEQALITAKPAMATRRRARVEEITFRGGTLRKRPEGRSRIGPWLITGDCYLKVAEPARARSSSTTWAGAAGPYVASRITIAPSTSRIHSSSIWPAPWAFRSFSVRPSIP